MLKARKAEKQPKKGSKKEKEKPNNNPKKKVRWRKEIL
jgi:hypothetical protein